MNHQGSRLRTLIFCLTWTLPLGLWPGRLTLAQPVTSDAPPSPQVRAENVIQAIVQLQGLKVPPPQIQGSTVLPLQPLARTRVYTVPVSVGRYRGRFLLDTGASTSIVSPEMVQQLKLVGKTIPKDRLGLAVAGDDCPNLQASLFQLPQLSMQDVQVQRLSTLNFSSTVIPEELSGVLGMDTLKFFDLNLHPQQKALHLRPATPLPSGWRPYVVPLQEKLGVMLAQVKVNDQGPFTFLLDTGADSTFISPEVAQKANLDASLHRPIQIRGFCGLEDAQRNRLTSVKLHTYQQVNLETIILSSSSILSTLGVDGILGQNFLNHYQQYWRFTPDSGGQFDGSLMLFPLSPN